MIAPVLDRHIDITPGIAGGQPRIAGHRITVRDIVLWHERMGKSADEICSEHDLALANVYAALTYYFDHREEVDLGIDESNAFVGEMRQSSSSPLKKKLDTLRGE